MTANNKNNNHNKRKNIKIHVQDLRKSFGKNEVLKGISIDIYEGEVVCVIGPSGSGKSTFLRCMNKLEDITSGEVIVDGFCISDKKVKEKIISDTGAYCTEMEGAAIAHAAWRNRIPFVIIRAISDKADDSAQMDYPTFEAIAAERCARVTQKLAGKLAE